MRRRRPVDRATFEAILDLDRQRRELLVQVEGLKAERNAASEEVARRKRAKEPADDLMARLKASGDEVKALDARLREIEAALDERALAVPNFPAEGSPDGDASANRVVRTWGEPPRFDFEPRPHWALGEALGMLDLPAGAKLAGSGFPLLRGTGARLIRALGSFMLDLHTREHGYEEVAPPYLVNRATATGTGPAAEVRGGSLHHPVGRSLPDPHRRGAGHQHSPGRDSRGGGPAARLLRLDAVLPA